jgi:hypothetical protein
MHFILTLLNYHTNFAQLPIVQGGGAEAATMHSRNKMHDTDNTDDKDHTDNVASSRALAAIMTRVQIEPAVDELLPGLGLGFRV